MRRAIPPTFHAPSRSPFTAALAAVLAATALTGCGSSASSATDADPATVIPADAQLLAGAIVRPSGALRSAALAAGQALSHREDPYLSLLAALETPGSPKLDYGREVAGWLGPRAGLFVTSPAGAARVAGLLERALLGGAQSSSAYPFSSGAEGALVMDTRDAAAARSFLDRQAVRAHASPSSYRGVAYERTTAGVAFARVKRFAVIGSAGAVRAVIDTSLGGASLAHASGYMRLAGTTPSNSLAQLYLAPAAGVQAAADAGAGANTAGLANLLALLAGARSTQVSLVPSAHSLTLDADIAGTPAAGLEADLFAAGAQTAHTLEELPGESWLALGLSESARDLGSETSALRALLALLAGSSGAAEAGVTATGTLSIGSLLGTLLEPLELLGANTARARREYSGWIGPAGVFASGSGLLELKGAVVIASRDAARSRSAVATLARELRATGALASSAPIPGTEAAQTLRLKGLPLSVAIAAGRNQAGEPRFVIGLGEASVGAALRPSSTLAHAPSRRAAAAALGEGISPVLILQVPTLLGLLESLGLAEASGLSTLLPYLHALTTITAGRSDLAGEVKRLRLVAGLQ
jgi:hypothetical protein